MQPLSKDYLEMQIAAFSAIKQNAGKERFSCFILAQLPRLTRSLIACTLFDTNYLFDTQTTRFATVLA